MSRTDKANTIVRERGYVRISASKTSDLFRVDVDLFSESKNKIVVISRSNGKTDWQQVT